MPILSTSKISTGNAGLLPDKLRAHLAMAGFAILIAGSFSIGHIAAPHIESTALNAIRFLIGSIFMGLVAVLSLRRLPKLPPSLWRIAVLGMLMGTYFVLMFMALRITSPISTGAVFTLIPFMSAGFGWLFLRQISSARVLISLLIAGCGAIWMVFRGDFNAILGFDIGHGELIYLFGCACHAAYAPLVPKFKQGMTTVEFTFWTLVATGVCIAIFGARDIVATDWVNLPPIVWWTIGYLSIFTTAITFFLLQFASLRLPASKVLSYGYLTPGFIILIEGLIGHGWANFSVLAGAVLTIAGLAFLILSPDS